MRILIAGAGAVGTHLAKLLGQENHDITLIDADRERLAIIRENTDILTCTGNCTSLRDLSEAGAGATDLYIGVTTEESKNIISCMLASSIGAKRTLARIDNYEYLLPRNREFFEKLGIHSMIYPELIAAREIALALKTPWVRLWWELCNGIVILAAARVRDNAPVVNRFLYDLPQANKRFHLVAIKRDAQTIIPKGSDRILSGDILYFTTLRRYVDSLPEMFGKRSFEARKIMFMGASRITMRTIELLPQNIAIKVIERDRERAAMLAEMAPPNVTVFVEDGRNTEFLLRENISDSDAFLALTGDSETNILGCMMAKQYGVRRTVAEVENIDYISMAERFDIGTVINKKLIAASKIYELLLKADASNIKSLTVAGASVGEVVAKPGSKVTGKLIRNLNLPPDITFGALIRNGEPILVDGDTLIEPYDQVVVFFLSKSLKSIEKLFNG
ncbi:MAG: Trk system potassium transporter TrkA [Proteiniphilum sp.]|jgi:trk system potassium uptake protein TrkA|nr:Trk system potassium transporter TrkA [Proteiniphilum sp.]